MAQLSRSELGLLRVVAQGLAEPGGATPQAILGRLLCLQAQDYRSGVGSLIARGATPAQIAGVFNDGAVVRSWPLRGTLHLIAAQDLGWVRALLSERVLATARTRESALGLTAAVIDRADVIARQRLSDGPASRSELTEIWQAAGIDTVGQRAYHLIWHLAQSGTLCLGPLREGEQVFVACDQWLPPSSRYSRDEALAGLAERFFTGHGPARPQDLSRWAKLTATDTRAAVTAARRKLTTITQDGQEYLLARQTLDELTRLRDEAAALIALPGFDELIFGYQDTAPNLSLEHREALFPHKNGQPCSTILREGAVVAWWKRAPRGAKLPVQITPLVDLTGNELAQAAARAGALLG